MFSNPRDERRSRETRYKEAIGSSLCISSFAFHSFRKVCFVTGRISSKEEICSGIQNEWHILINSGGLDCANAFGLRRNRMQPFALHDPVLEVDANSTRA